MMNQNGDTTGLEAFRNNWWSDRQSSGFPSFLTGPGANTSGQDDQGAQLAQATQAQAQTMTQGMQAQMRAGQLQNAAPEVAQGLQDGWASQAMGQTQTQGPSAMMQALQAQMRMHQLRASDPDVAGHLQAMWATQDRAGGG